MKKISLIVSSLLVLFLMTGCSSKNDVGFDGANKQNASAQSNGTDTQNVVSAVDKDMVKVTDDKLAYVNVVESDVNGQKVAIKSVHFAFDKYNLTDEMAKIAKDNYGVINPLVQNNKNLKIKLEGNCDEWGTDEYNYALGLKRAKTVKDTLVNDGISADKIVLVSFGESNPVCTDKTSACWKKNRRVDYRLLP